MYVIPAVFDGGLMEDLFDDTIFVADFGVVFLST
jgi:hypothetical protein